MAVVACADVHTGWKKTLVDFTFGILKKIPAVQRKIEAEKAKSLKALETSLFAHPGPDVGVFESVPAAGLPHQEIVAKMTALRDFEFAKCSTGKLSGGVYHGGAELCDLITKAFNMFLLSNPLHSDVFPSIRKMESEVVRPLVSPGHM